MRTRPCFNPPYRAWSRPDTPLLWRVGITTLGIVLGCFYGLAVLAGLCLLHIGLPLLGALLWVYALPALLLALVGRDTSLTYYLLYGLGIWLGAPFVFGMFLGAVALLFGRPARTGSVSASYPPAPRITRRRMLLFVDADRLPAPYRSPAARGRVPIVLEEEVIDSDERACGV